MNLDHMEDQYRRALRNRPDDGGLYHDLGLIYMQKGQPKEAAEAFKDALRLEPDMVQARHFLAVAYAEMGDLSRAEREWEAITSQHPDHAMAHYFLGWIHTARGELEEAAERLEEARELSPDQSRVHNTLGEVYVALGRPMDAIEAWKKVLELDPKEIRALHNLAAALYDQGFYDEAINVGKEAIKIGSRSFVPRINVALAYLAKNELDDAEKYMREALDADMDNEISRIDAMVNLGEILARQGRLDDACDTWREVLRVQPGHIDAHFNLGQAARLRGDYEKALEHWDQALRSSSELPDEARMAYEEQMRANRALVLMNQGSHEQALEECLVSAESNPSEPMNWVRAALIAFRAGWLDKANEYAEQAVSADETGEHLGALFMKGALSLSRGELAEGARLWKHVLDDEPRSPTVVQDQLEVMFTADGLRGIVSDLDKEGLGEEASAVRKYLEVLEPEAEGR